jgi:hypothetical protein
MEWEVLLAPEFDAWLLKQERGVRVAIAAHAGLLKEFGPALGRPQVDTLKGSKLAHLKELRIQYQGAPWRVLFVFDPKRPFFPIPIVARVSPLARAVCF